MIRKIAISGALIIGEIIALIFERNSLGKHYATLIIATVFAFYWLVEQVISYVEFRKSYNRKYDFYKARLVNSSGISLAQIEANNKVYYKKFKRTMLKDSFVGLGMVFLWFGMVIAFIVTLSI